MGSGKFDIRPDSLLAAAAKFDRSAQDLAQAIEALQSRVMGSGSPWGKDELGSIFAEAYVECSDVGLQAMAHLAEQLGSIAEGLQAMGQNLSNADQAGTAMFDQTAPGL